MEGEEGERKGEGGGEGSDVGKKGEAGGGREGGWREEGREKERGREGERDGHKISLSTMYPAIITRDSLLYSHLLPSPATTQQLTF